MEKCKQTPESLLAWTRLVGRVEMHLAEGQGGRTWIVVRESPKRWYLCTSYADTADARSGVLGHSYSSLADAQSVADEIELADAELAARGLRSLREPYADESSDERICRRGSAADASPEERAALLRLK